MVNPVWQSILSSAREEFNGTISGGSGVGRRACRSGFSLPSGISVAKKIEEIATHAHVVISKERVNNTLLELQEETGVGERPSW